MKLVLNDHELSANPARPATLGAALLDVQQNHLTEDQVISAIFVDGSPLTAKLLSQWKDRPASDFAEARIEAPCRSVLACQGLRILAQGLAESQQDRSRIVELFCQGRPAQGMQLLTGYLNLWNSTQATLASAARLLAVDLEDLPTTADPTDPLGTVGQYIARLAEQLQQLKNALEAQDYVLTGDILEYEFAPLTDEWQSVLTALADQYENHP